MEEHFEWKRLINGQLVVCYHTVEYAYPYYTKIEGTTINDINDTQIYWVFRVRNSIEPELLRIDHLNKKIQNNLDRTIPKCFRYGGTGQPMTSQEVKDTIERVLEAWQSVTEKASP
jgi:hypothetical protein